MLPPEQRLPDARALIGLQQYFVVHAPRQTGKTTAIWSLAQELTAEGRHVALRLSCETSETARDDIAAAEAQILDSIRVAARSLGLKRELLPPDPWPEAPAGRRLFNGLQDWAVRSPLPLVLFFDEIDSLTGDSLRAVLRQLREGFDYRAHAFPASVILCGLRHPRDYKAAAGGGPTRMGGASPFNIAVKSLRVRDFTAEEIAELYAQHTHDTGQEFTPEAVERAWEYTQGQPWLVNALAWEITFEMHVEAPTAITAGHIDVAKERLILAGATHLDSLASKLREPRVRRVIEPLITGTEQDDDGGYSDDSYDEDLEYARDLGLIARDRPVRVANPIYREVIVRVLGSRTADRVTDTPYRFVLPDGRLDMARLLDAFTEFWVENGEILVRRNEYHEAAPHLVFMAFLQRIVNGGGYVSREYGVGRGRIDILVRKPYGDHREQREAIELKVWHPDKPDPLPAGLAQLDRYLDRLGLDAGTLVIFDRRPGAAPIHERTVISQVTSPAGHQATLVRA